MNENYQHMMLNSQKSSGLDLAFFQDREENLQPISTSSLLFPMLGRLRETLMTSLACRLRVFLVTRSPCVVSRPRVSGIPYSRIMDHFFSKALCMYIGKRTALILSLICYPYT